jgi:peptidoglycan/xylan/chitin deacetylase (PgdA/CDA1 family)
MYYPVKTPWWLRQLYPSCTWEMPADQQAVYLSFDDGPDPSETAFVLDLLKAYGVKATFFCIGKNVHTYPEIYQRIIREGHRVGNHTHNHLNGWKVSDSAYFEDILEARKYIDSDLFRPPYGRATRFQMQCLGEGGLKMKIIMWSVLSGDFDTNITPEQCFENVYAHLRPGAIITFHDSRKASPRLRYALPEVLKKMSEKGLVGKGL